MKAINWICQNKEWIFSGIGITIITIGCTVLGIIFRKRKHKDDFKAVIKQINKGRNITQVGIQNNYNSKED